MTPATQRISGNIIDIPRRQIFSGEVVVEEGVIRQIIPTERVDSCYILPGFIDAHVHIESSMLVPSEFARLASVRGTVATVSDPHEIANVLGIPGVEFMIENGRQVPFKFYFGAPSCVPATNFETAGASLGPDAVDELLRRPEVKYLAEMMNWPGVVNHDSLVLEKIAIAKKYGKTIDGHAPGLNRAQAEDYIRAGIHTDHECVSLDEARHKLQHGMKVIIREGSAARNFDALIDLLPEFEDSVMFCSDDKHPDSLEDGHIDALVRRAIARRIDIFSILKAACINPIEHYQLNVGQLRVDDPADFIVIDDPKSFTVMKTYVGGTLIAENGKTRIPSVPIATPNNFHALPINAQDFQLKATSQQLRVIEAQDGQLLTKAITMDASEVNGLAVADPARDLLKIAVVNRYSPAKPAVAFIRNFGLRQGAIASSVAHDSHNIIVVGASDEAMAMAVHVIIEQKGGISLVSGEDVTLLPLPVAGIMSADDGYSVARQYRSMDQQVKSMGSKLGAPFMTLSFMALLVIPSLKLSDKGLFDGDAFTFTPVFR